MISARSLAGDDAMADDADEVRQLGAVPIRSLTADVALARIVAAVSARQSLVVAFCNAHTVNIAAHDAAFAAVLRDAFVLNDGIGVEIGSRLTAGSGFPENLNGTDLTPRLLAALERRTRLFLVGSAVGVAETAARELEARFPRVEVVGVQHGFFSAEEAQPLAARIAASGAELVLVGMGQPRQEFWAAQTAGSVNAVFCCIGAFLDFTAGVVSRAPAWVRRWRMEWMYRLLLEPRRMTSRYVVGNGVFLARMAAQAARARWSGGRRPERR